MKMKYSEKEAYEILKQHITFKAWEKGDLQRVYVNIDEEFILIANQCFTYSNGAWIPAEKQEEGNFAVGYDDINYLKFYFDKAIIEDGKVTPANGQPGWPLLKIKTTDYHTNNFYEEQVTAAILMVAHYQEKRIERPFEEAIQ
jgi:hypothetical protein